MSDEYEPLRQQAAHYRLIGRRHREVRCPPLDLAGMMEMFITLGQRIDALKAENAELQAKLDAKDAPKYAPFAAKKRA